MKCVHMATSKSWKLKCWHIQPFSPKCHVRNMALFTMMHFI